MSNQASVHLCDEGQQGDIRIACDQTWTEAAWGKAPNSGLPEGVYRTDDDRLYTFTDAAVSCSACVEWIAERGRGYFASANV